jgi:Protein of unknown function (DUF3532).
MKPAIIESARVDDELITFCLSDGRVLSAPTAWSSRLLGATSEERAKYEISASGTIVEWPVIDEHIGLWTMLGVSEDDVLESVGFDVRRRKAATR